MAKSTTTITHVDGTTRKYPIPPSAIIKTEEYLSARGRKLSDSPYTGTAFAAYTQARRFGDTNAGFDEWLDTVESITDKNPDEPEDGDEADTFHG